MSEEQTLVVLERIATALEKIANDGIKVQCSGTVYNTI